jgi:hypothetical protein
MTMARRRRRLGLGLLAALAFALFAYRQSTVQPTAKKTLADTAGGGAQEQEPMSRPSAWPMVPEAANPEDPNLPIIDAVTVDKTEVCRGEENFLNVKAHTGNGTDAFLTTTMRDPGSPAFLMGRERIPFRLNEPIERPIRVTVEGNMTSKTIELPAIRVKDCVAPRQVLVHVQRTMAAMDRVTLRAELLEHPPAGATEAFQPLVPASYEWDFGDGQKQQTTTASTEHSYENREQNVRQSSFVATVTVKDGQGRAAQGATAIAFPNGAFARLRFKNEVVISIGVKEADPATKTHEQIWLYHGYDKPVRIEDATLIELVRGDDGTIKETLRRPYSAEKLLGLSELPPGKSSTIRDLTDLQPVAPEAVRHVELRGRSQDGKEASGAFTLLPPKPTAADTTAAAILPSDPETDMEKIK